MPNQRFDNLDLLRCWAIVMVVFVHASAHVMAQVDPNGAAFAVLSALNQAGRAGPVAFMTLVGFFLAHSAEARSPNAALRKRLTKLLPPYLFWASAIFLGTSMLGAERGISFWSWAFAVLTGTAAHPHYFFIVVLQAYLLWWLFARAGWDAVQALALLIPLHAALLVVRYLQALGRGPELPMIHHLFFGWSSFILLGVALRRHWGAVQAWARRRRGALAVVAVLLLASSYAEFRWSLSIGMELGEAAHTWKLSTLLYSTAVILWFCGAQGCGRGARRLADYSFPIFLTHEPLLYFLTAALMACCGALGGAAAEVAIGLSVPMLGFALLARFGRWGVLLGAPSAAARGSWK